MELKILLNSIFNHLLFRSFVVAVIVLLASTKSVTAGNGPIADLFVWNGSTNSDWATGSNWTITRGTTGTSNSYPGQTTATDSVTISNGGSPTVASGSYSVARLIINNLTGPIGGSTLTINSGSTITVSGSGGATQGSPAVLLKGGNIVNNGTLTVTSTDASAPTYLIYFSTPTTLPGIATTYGYTGTGTLNLTNNVAGQISYGVMHTATNANTSYRFNVSGALNYTAPNGSYVLTVPENTISPLVIGGTGYTLGSVGSPVTLGLIRQNGGGGTNVTVDTGTSLTLWSASGNTARGVYVIC